MGEVDLRQELATDGVEAESMFHPLGIQGEIVLQLLFAHGSLPTCESLRLI